MVPVVRYLVLSQFKLTLNIMRFLITGGLHGDEVSVFAFLKELQTKNKHKEIIITDFINLEGLLKREHNYQGIDLNRHFDKDIELLKPVKKLILETDFIIDLHSNTRGKTFPYGVVYNKTKFKNICLKTLELIGLKYFEETQISKFRRSLNGTSFIFCERLKKPCIVIELPSINSNVHFDKILTSNLINLNSKKLKQTGNTIKQTIKITTSNNILITKIFIKLGQYIKMSTLLFEIINLDTMEKNFLKSKSEGIIITLPEKGVYLKNSVIYRTTKN